MMKTGTKIVLLVVILLVIAGLVWLGISLKNEKKMEVNEPHVVSNVGENSSELEKKVGTSENLKPEELLPNEFFATIERREGNTLIVKQVNTDLEAKVAKEIGIVIDGKEIDIDAYAVGDLVKIAYFNGITEVDEMYRITGAQWIEKVSGEN